jgi:hypothetical protein
MENERGPLVGELGGLAVHAECAVDAAGRQMTLEEAAALPGNEAWVAAALRGFAGLEAARRTRHKLAKLASLARWPTENGYLREVRESTAPPVLP